MRSIRLGLVVITVAALTIWLIQAALDPRLPDPCERPTLYANQCRHDLRLTLSAAIDQATQTVHLATYTLREPQIVAALRRAVNRGVEVVVTIDARKAGGLKKRLGPGVRLIKRRGKGLMHQKLIVIDGRQIWLGTANMTYESLRAYGNLVVALEQPDLAQQLICTMGHDATPLERHFWSGDQQLEYWALPSDLDALERVIALINAARCHVRVAMFTWTHPQLTAAIIAAHERGVTVEVVIDRASGRGASHKSVTQLHAAEIATNLSMGPELLHHKFAWIDDQLIVGSANWTKSAFTKNHDCFLVLHHLDQVQQKQLKQLWRVIVLESKPVNCYKMVA